MPRGRRYEALRARERGAPESPEGKLCGAIADRIAELHPTLCEDTGEVERREHRWRTPPEQELLARIIRYFGCVPLVYGGRRSRTKVLIVDADREAHELIEETFRLQAPRLRQVLEFATGGFLAAALPLRRELDEEDEDELNLDDLDHDLLQISVMAAKFGLPPRHALTQGTDDD